MADSAVVGILRVLLSANTTEFEAGMSKASKTAKLFGGDLGGLAISAAGLFGLGLGCERVVAFGRALLDAADATVKLSDKTCIAIEPLQRLQYVAEQSGNTLEQVTKAVTQMQNRLAEGDKSAVGALQQLGLSLQDIIHLSPDEQFMT